MKIKRFPINAVSLEEFADKHNLTMEVRERDDGSWYAKFEDVHVVTGMCLVGEFGNGATEFEAIENYAKEISKTTIRVGYHNGINIKVPNLIYTGDKVCG